MSHDDSKREKIVKVGKDRRVYLGKENANKTYEATTYPDGTILLTPIRGS